MSHSRVGIENLGAVLVLVLVGASTPLVAQVHHNLVMRFGVRDLVQSAKHPVTKYHLEVPGAQPPAFTASSSTGVAAGTLTWLWYPSQLNKRLEDRFVTGHLIAVRPSSATPLSEYSKTHSGQTQPGVPVYLPKFAIHRARPRPPRTPTPAFGNGFDPDFRRAPLLTYNTVHRPVLPAWMADAAVLWAVTYNTKFKISSQEIVLSYEWQGGEHYRKPLSQSLPTGWSESMFTPSHWGWAGPAPNRTIQHFDPKKILPGTPLTMYTSPMGGYFEDQATIAMHSDWGERREPGLAGKVYPSYNVGSGLSDLASTAGNLGWDAFTSPKYRGLRALPLLNVRVSPYPFATPLLSRVLEVDPADPMVAMLWGHPLADGRIDHQGVWLPSKRIAVPALGSTALGLWIGMEFAIVDPVSGTAPETTQAYWFFIEK